MKKQLNFNKRVIDIALQKRYEVTNEDKALLELYQNYIILKNANKPFEIEKIKKDFLNQIVSVEAKERLDFLINKSPNYIWGLMPRKETSRKILNAINGNYNLFFAEDAFLRSIVTSSQFLKEENRHFQTSIGYFIDDLTLYFDSTKVSRLELILNSDFIVSKEQIERSKRVIKKLVENKISKYNNQPVSSLNIGRKGRKKVLVVDQSFNDYSILKGGANEETFKLMLNSAVKENPDFDIIIKTHPDTTGSTSLKPKGYLKEIEEKENIFKLDRLINPFSLINYVDKVYVCSTQLGFEALMCNKPVVTFGLPFYSNWGLTTDKQILKRRTKKRSLEEIFYVAYIYLALYINPKTNEQMEIEEAIDFLIEQRKEFFNKGICCG